MTAWMHSFVAAHPKPPRKKVCIRTGWHIDHKKPLTAFEFHDDNGAVRVEEVKAAVALDNLQPLWAGDNIRKSSHYMEA